MSNYYIKDDAGNIINSIVADQTFVETAYPNQWELIPEQSPLDNNTVNEFYISGVEFLRRFNTEQRITIRELARTDLIMSDFLFLLDATITSGGKINLDDPDTIAGVGYIYTQLATLNITIDPAYILRK